MFAKLASLHLLLTVVCATIPTLSGYHTVFYDDFNGVSGSVADRSKWNQVTIKNAKNLKQTQIYTALASNAHLSGDGQLYIIPKRGKGSRGEVYYTSARLESYGSWKCDNGKAMVFQAELRVPDMTGSPSKYEGLWPAFWTKGLSSRQGIPWPDCGEWDIFEQNNHMGSKSQGTLHYRKADGTYTSDLNQQTGYKGGAYNTWAFKVDRRNADWKKQTLTFYVNGHQYLTVTGAKVATSKQWEILASQPYYIILNMALGAETDSYAGKTTEQTVMGYESSLRVKYVAVYKSN
ncbi:glycoside hydrolase family 16 protein [Dactylonectria estremocensis]|uniref:Glycoside hydrolase family 16 protein n=1 Tax=Dactylonectria estremocensis TaxID=1079267 RepID=A0A9P9DXS6_9HYPO|nr:glycoside hydrolase family 16 protein [Dactylonectria estremocensis]